MSNTKTQLFSDSNPLLIKYLNSGDVPAQYVPPDKRKKVSQYMNRTHINTGQWDGKFGKST